MVVGVRLVLHEGVLVLQPLEYLGGSLLKRLIPVVSLIHQG